jgi:hypothetical protein
MSAIMVLIIVALLLIFIFTLSVLAYLVIEIIVDMIKYIKL